MKPRSFKFAFIASLFYLLLFADFAVAEKTITASDLYDKMRGMWLGQLIGNCAGRATESRYSGSTPDPNISVPFIIKSDPVGWDADDDTDIEYIAVHTLEANGFDCNAQEIASQWRKHITSSGIYIANRQAWYLMGTGLYPSDTGSRTFNEHWYSIDSQITTETLGAVSPCLVQSAIELSGKFAHTTNTGFPVHAAELYAAMYAMAFYEPNVLTIVRDALNTIPHTSRTYQVASDVLDWYLADSNDGVLNWRATRYKLYQKYGLGDQSYGRYYNWLESCVNTGSTVLAILYGGNDFKQTVQIGVLAGWDCDCNPATAGGLIGIIKGFSGLPRDLTDPNICGNVYKNVYRPYLPNQNLATLPQNDTITGIASRLTNLAEQNIFAHDGWKDNNEPITYHIPEPAIMPEPELPDPTGPSGLVAQARAAGINVTVQAAVANRTTNNDRLNLDSIIDGIGDNSYNGHMPYYSYVSVPSARPAKDWYQINFSKPVKFDHLIFYEGDIMWSSNSGINIFYLTDSAKGGFFTDIGVKILRDGKFITPANIQLSEPLDRFKIYQTITFSFAPTVGDAIRIIGTAGGTDQFTTIMELEAQGQVDPGLYVASVRIADSQLQRSNVSNVSVVFSHDVTIDTNGITLVGTRNGTNFSAQQISFSYNSSLHQLSLQFDMDNDSQLGDSLPDDTYELRLNCNKVHDSNGTMLLDDDSNPSDGSYAIAFHRLYGDMDGSARVDMADMAVFASAWLQLPASTAIDFNHDSAVNFLDLAEFSKRWLKNFN